MATPVNAAVGAVAAAVPPAGVVLAVAVAVLEVGGLIVSIFGGRGMTEQELALVRECREQNAALLQKAVQLGCDAAVLAQDGAVISAGRAAAGSALHHETVRLRDELQKPHIWRTLAPDALLERAKLKLRARGQSLDECRFNIAFVGPTGAGKTSLLNALLERLPELLGVHTSPHQGPPGYRAPTSAVEEGTLRMNRFDVDGTLLTLWDVPGANTRRAPTASYVDDMCLAVFPLLLVFGGGRVLEVHRDLIRELHSKYPAQRIMYVIAQGDELLVNMRNVRIQNAQCELSQAQLVAEAKRTVFADLTGIQANITPMDVFIVSAMGLAGLKDFSRMSLDGPLDEAAFMLAIMNYVHAQAVM